MTEYFTDAEAKHAIIEIGKRVFDRGFVAANDGNITVKVGENAIWATPAGVSKGFMREEMLVKMDLDGTILAGDWGASSEVKMHLRVFKENPDVRCVIHAHPVCATAFAVAGDTLEPDEFVEPMIIIGEVPVADFAVPGTYEVPDSIAPYCCDHNCVLLANHGALTWGRTPMEAFFRLDSLERYCMVRILSKYVIGKSTPLPEDKAERVHEMHARKKLKPPAKDIY